MGLFDAFSGIFGGGEEDIKIPPLNVDEIINRQVQLNRINQITPFGSLTYEGPQKSTLRFQLSPELQQLLNQQIGFGGAAVGQGMGLLSALPMTGDAAVQAQLQRLEPTFQRQESRLRERLEQSGHPAALGTMMMGEGAYNDLALLNQMQNDARLAAIMQGPAYQGQMIQNALGLGYGSPVGMPQYAFQGPTPIDVLGPYGLGQQGQMFNAQYGQGVRWDILGGLFDLGSAVLGGIFA